MDTVKRQILASMILCLNKIHQYSVPDLDKKESEAVEHLARAYSYLYQLKED